MIITSFANERIKEIRKLHERKYRQDSGLYWIEGLRIVAEAVTQRAPLDMLVVAPDLLRSAFGRSILNEQRERGVTVLEVSPEVFGRLSIKEGPQGIAAVVRQQWTALDDIALEEAKTWVALDSVADPGNLGTILRTLDAVGGAGVILLDQATDPYDPSAVRASMGALYTQKLVRCALEDFAAWQRARGVAVVGTSDKAQVDYHVYRYPSALVLLMGSERQGLGPRHLELCQEIVSIPMRGVSDSLNLAVATGVVLYEIFNQQRGIRKEDRGE